MTWTPFTNAELDIWEAELRSCIGIRWRHMGRKGLPYGHQTGLDCVGLMVRGAQAVGRPVQDLESYSRDPDGTLQSRLDAHLGDGKLPAENASIVLIAMVGHPSHVAYISRAGTIIHAYNGGTGTVCEHPLGLWTKRILRGWCL